MVPPGLLGIEIAIRGDALLERFQLLRNVGQYASVNAGAQIPLSTLTLIYGENGRGKSAEGDGKEARANHDFFSPECAASTPRRAATVQPCCVETLVER